MVGERLGDVHQDDLAVGIAEVGVGATHGELRDNGVPVAIGVVHEEARIRGVVGVEGQAEQTAFAAAGDPPGDIEEWTVDQGADLDQADPPRLLDDEQPPAAVAGVGDIDRGVEPADRDRDVDGDRGWVERSRSTGRRAGCRRATPRRDGGGGVGTTEAAGDEDGDADGEQAATIATQRRVTIRRPAARCIGRC